MVKIRKESPIERIARRNRDESDLPGVKESTTVF